MNYSRYIHNQLVERRAKVPLYSWGLFFVLQVKWPYTSDVGLLRYHVKSMVTDDDKIDKLTQWKAVSELYGWGFHPQHPRITNFEEKGSSPIVDNVR